MSVRRNRNRVRGRLLGALAPLLGLGERFGGAVLVDDDVVTASRSSDRRDARLS
jgi:hypothetical protein